MASGDGTPEQGRAEGTRPTINRAEIEKAIDERDARFLSPTERAARFYRELQKRYPELTNWDLVCFCSYYLMVAANEFPFLEEPVKEVARLITFTHYRMDEEGLKSILEKFPTEVQTLEPSHEPAPDETKG